MGWLLLFLMMATAGVLVAGIVVMAKGGEANRQYGNKLMTARVWLQALCLIVLALMFTMNKSS